MHMGSMRTIGNLKSKNFKHILLNNNMHESVGGQVTHAKNINFNKLVKSIGYKNYFKANNELNYTKAIKKLMKSSGPSLLEVKINPGTIKNLIRPKNFLKIKRRIYEMISKWLKTNSIKDLKYFLKDKKFKKIFLLTGKKSYYLSGANKIFDGIEKNKVIKFFLSRLLIQSSQN